MAPISSLRRDASLSEDNLHRSCGAVNDIDGKGLCNDGFQEESTKETNLERVPRSPRANFENEIDIQSCPKNEKIESLLPKNNEEASLSIGKTVNALECRSSKEGFAVHAYPPLISESRNETFVDASTMGGLQKEEKEILREKTEGKIDPLPEKTQLNDDIGRWRSMTHGMYNISRPIMKKHNALPQDPNKGDKLRFAFTCPPHGQMAATVTWLLFLGLLWLTMVYIAHEEALPGGTLFSLFILIICSQLGGILVSKVRLPPLLGMLVVGILFRSVPGLDVIGANITPLWSSTLRSTALVVILIRAGLGLDPKALRKLSLVVVRLAALPCLTEAVTVAVVSHFLLGFPWIWGLMLGFVLSAVSPAVVVPCLLSLQDQGWGVAKGIPTLVVAAASIDDVIAISGFGVALGVAFSSGSPAWQGMKGPIELVIGFSYGIIVGVILWLFPNKRGDNATKWRFIMLFLAGLLAIFGSKGIKFDGAGALACLCVAFVAMIGYRNKPSVETGAQVKDYFNYLWLFFQPLLFGLIGTEIKVTELDAETIGWGIVTLLIGLTLRVLVSFLAVIGGGFNVKERLFVALAWLPKATVQAAIGSIALDNARLADGNPDIETDLEIMGKKVLTIAVLVILLTAPIGAIAIMFTAPKLLQKGPAKSEVESSPS